MEIKEIRQKRVNVLNAIQDELNLRSKKWEELCSLPNFGRYEDIRAKIEKTKQKLEELEPRLKQLQAEYNAVPNIEKNIVSLFAKMLKCKIKYKFNNKYKNMLRYEEALYDFNTKRTKRKLKLGELYGVQNKYDLLVTSLRTLRENPEYAEIHNARVAIKGGKLADNRQLDFFIYANRDFDPSIYSYKTLVNFKKALQKDITFDKMIEEGMQK